MEGDDLTGLLVHGEPEPVWVGLLLHEAPEFICLNLETPKYYVTGGCNGLYMEMLRYRCKVGHHGGRRPKV